MGSALDKGSMRAASVYMLPHFHQDAFVILIIDFVLFQPPGADAETFHPDPSNVWYDKCLLAFSFILRLSAKGGSRRKLKSSYQPWKNMYAQMIQLQVRVCVYVVLHCSS